MADDLDRQHQRGQPPDGPGKAGRVLEAVRLNPDQVVINEGRQRAARRHRGILRRGFEAGNEPDQVGRQNEKKDGAEVPQVPAAVVPDLIFRLAVHKFVNQLESLLEVARPVGRQPQPEKSDHHHEEEDHHELHDHEVGPRPRIGVRAHDSQK